MLSYKEKLAHFCLILLCALGLLISFIPFLCFLVGILIYRGCVWHLLKKQFGDTFGGFLTSHDALWGVEEDNSWSIIHSLLLFEATASQQDLFGAFEERLKTRLGQTQFTKVFQKRQVKYGYNFLVNVPPDKVKLSEYLKLVDVPSDGDFISKVELQSWIAGLYNTKLPDDHLNFLEIFVSRKALEGPPQQQNQVVFIPVLIRIHHSLADGVAIVKMLTTPLTETINGDGPDRSDSRAPPPPVVKVLQNVLKGLARLPQIILAQRKPPDFNSLHGVQSSKNNFVNWYFETAAANQTEQPETTLLNKIKTIKAAMESGITFQDVICLSLSVALHHHFAAAVKCNLLSTPPPEWITIGNAVQLGEARKMTNNCAYNFERIPIAAPAMTKGDLLAALQEIRKARAEDTKLQQINVMIIRLCSLFPSRYLWRMVSRNRCSLGLSNIPGPAGAIYVGPYLIKHLTFWTPNRFKTRLGVSFFTLEGRLHLGIGGDQISFTTNAFAESEKILQGIVTEINRMYTIATE